MESGALFRGAGCGFWTAGKEEECDSVRDLGMVLFVRTGRDFEWGQGV